MSYKRYYRGKTVLVTGGAGAIGSNLSRALAELGASVIILDNLSASGRWNVPSVPGVLFVEGDILNEICLKRVFFEEPQIVFHLAAFFANQNSIDYPETDLMVNGLGALRLLQYSRLSGVERFVYVSSRGLYGDMSRLPLREEFVSLNLSSPYQITKMLGELYCSFFSSHYGLEIVRPRVFNSYGPGEVPGQYRNVIPNFMYWAMKGLSLPITGTGEETRDFTYVGDIVDGLLRTGYLKEALGEEFNLASGREMKIVDLAEVINDLAGNRAPIQFFQRRKWDTKARSLGSVEKAGRLIGYRPNMPLEEGLKNTSQWFREHWDQIQESARFGPGISSAVCGPGP